RRAGPVGAPASYLLPRAPTALWASPAQAQAARFRPLPEQLDNRAEVPFFEPFRAIAAGDEVLFGGTGQHLRVLRANDISGLVVEQGRDEADDIVACGPHDTVQTNDLGFERTERAGRSGALDAVVGECPAAVPRKRTRGHERQRFGGRRVRDPLAGVVDAPSRFRRRPAPSAGCARL